MLDIDKLINDVRNIANKYPEAEYNKPYGHCTCYYNLGDCGLETEGCLIGQAARQQPEFFKLIEFQTETIISIIEENFIDVYRNQFNKVKWLQAVQDLQDEGYCWKSCVECADDEYPIQS